MRKSINGTLPIGGLIEVKEGIRPDAAVIGPQKPIFVLSYGMGVESHAILERWCNEAESRPFEDFSQLIVITAQIGEEHKCDTVPHVERRALPLMRKHGIRFVEVARRGHLEEDGIVVLQDTREPYQLHPDGVYKLSDELLASGTVPQFGGEHRCALKFKAFVIETWLAFEFGGDNRDNNSVCTHVFGYNAEELSRSLNSDVHIVRHNDDRLIEAPRTPIVVFGFNAEEIGRIDRAKQYDGPSRIGSYPLQEWGWTRDMCHDYILKVSGIDWKKSACAFCPFCSEAAKGLASVIERWLAAPEQTAHGLMVEYNSMCFNPRGHLFKDKALLDVVKRNRVQSVLDVFEKKLNEMSWGIYRVRRIYTAKGKAFRCVEKVETGTRDEMSWRFRALTAEDASLRIEEKRGIEYAMFQTRKEDIYPALEGFWVIAPLFVESKVRGPIAKFDERWRQVLASKTLGEKVSDPNQEELAFAGAV